VDRFIVACDHGGMSLNHDLSDLFKNFAAIMEIKGESVFKAIAFSKVGRILKDMTIDIRQLAEQGKLAEVEGIGDSSRRIIEQYLKEGRSKDYQDAAASVPEGLLPMLEIPGMGPKTIALVWKERNVTSIDELVRAIDQGKLDGLKGIGEKKLQSIKEGIALRAQASARMGIAEALPIATALRDQLAGDKRVTQCQIAGSLRRMRETVGDVDIVCSVSKERDGPAISKLFSEFAEVDRVLGQGPTKCSIVTKGGLQVDLRIVPDANFGAALLYFTGSKDHNVKIRGLAQDKAMTLNEWGLYKLSDYNKAKKETGRPSAAKPVASESEVEIYAKLGMDFVEPELREDRGEVDLALAHKLPRIVQLKDYRGDLHSHTTASDGTASIEQMAEAALARGYEYLAITDHSKSSVIANGLSVERLLKHVKEIHRVGDRIKGITLLAGCEVDILADGHLDYEDAVLRELDFVVASPHVALKQDEGKATDRLLRAINTRCVNLIGHPTGRLINARAGLPLNFGKIFQAAADSGTALEINSGYPRLDLNDVNARAAAEAGATISINTDAHSTDGFDEIRWGIGVARRAGLTKKTIINCMKLPELRAFIEKKK
jgi:DNA polymerase (family 10)